MGLAVNPKVYSDYAEKLHSIEEELHAQPVTSELREQIIHELDEVHTGISQLESTAAHVNQFAQSFLKDLRQKAIFLYGETDDFFYKHEVDVIQGELHSLDSLLHKNDLTRTASILNSLKTHISELLDSFSPGLQERRILVLAHLMIERAEAALRGESLTDLSPDEWAFLEAEEILEEIAEYLGSDDRRGLRFFWDKLSTSQKKLASAYLNPGELSSYFVHGMEGASSDQAPIFG